ncbi:MAG TPA: FadR/GntR family transcriptional regulator [Acidimicrobiales bacterium]|nr:FadR/GntR family transcriptional regulator [Acidimicrobiales bacterium]
MAQWREIRKDSLVQRLVVELRGQITSGRLAVGDRLPPEPELAGEFGVSRPLLREALAELRAEGFVQTFTGRGTFVSLPTEEDLADAFAWQLRMPGTRRFSADELYEARGAIELCAVELAAERASAEEIATLEKLLASMTEASKDAAGYTAADVGFHVAVARASRNSLLPALLLPIVSTIVEGVFESHGAKGATELGIAAHARILAALRSKDRVAARAAMSAHLRESRSLFPEPVTDRPSVPRRPGARAACRGGAGSTRRRRS